MCNAVRTLIVDDSKAARNTLSHFLEAHKNIDVIGTADNGRVAVEKVGVLKPDLVLMDLYMPEMDGMETARVIRRRFPDVRIVAFSIDDRDETRQGFEAAGAHGFIWKLYLDRDIDAEIQKLFKIDAPIAREK